jgi:RNA polymerase sigma-70 factor (ECF subfamily)
MSATEDSDATLAARICDGDNAAFRVLVERYQSVVYGCAWAVTGNAADAADAAQEAFIRLHRNIEQFDRRRPLKPYLMRIAANCARNAVAARSRTRTAENYELATVPAPGRGPATEIIRGERHQAVRDRVGSLPATLRQVCSLFYLSDCSCREVAEILNMSESAVKVALHRARRQLAAGGLGDWRRT